MTMRILSVVAALAVVVGIPVASVKLLQHRRSAAARTQAAADITVRRYPSEYVGIVSNDIAAFDTRCQCRPNAAIHYISMGGPVNVTLAKLALDDGAVPLLELEPYGIPLRWIVAGREDTWLTRYAKALLRLKAPVIMSFAPEANGDWYEWGFRDTRAEVYVQAWQHVVTVFRRAGARAIKWAWIMNVEFPESESLNRLWPGGAYVNMLGIDGYFTTPQDTFGSVFIQTIDAMRELSSDPILITETAAGPAAGKLRVVNELVAALNAYHLDGFLWFDIAQKGDYMHEDWQLETDPQALAAYRRVTQRYAFPAR